MKKLITYLIISLVITSSFGYLSLPAEAATTSSTAYYSAVLNRLSSIGILNSSLKSNFQKTPNSALTREEMAVMLVVSSNLSSELANYKNINLFSDIKPNYTFKAYINTAVRKGLMTAYPDKKFHSKNGVTYAQAISTLVKMLGYSDSDLSGIWPQNYLEKAKKLALTSGISFSQNSNISKANFAKMVDRLLVTSVKKNTNADATISFAENAGLFTECVVLADSNSSQELYNKEVQTDRGIYNNLKNVKLNVGEKYRFVLNGNDITSVYQCYSSEQISNIKNYDENIITYSVNNTNKTITLPSNAVYYYNGVKQSYDNLKNILKLEQSINFTLNLDRTNYEYAVITDPSSSKLGTYMECIVLDNNTTNSSLQKNQISTDKGIFQVSNSSLKFDIGSKYGVYYKDDTINGIYKKINTTVKAEVVADNDLTVSVNDNGTNKKFILPQKAVYYYKGVKQSYDTITNILKQNQSIYLGYASNNENYEYCIIKDPFDEAYGTYTSFIVFDDYTTSNKLQPNQYLTDKGIYQVSDSSIKLEIGNKYAGYVKNDTINGIYKVLNSSAQAKVLKDNDSSVTVYQNNVGKTFTLPEKTVYYYNGEKQSYSNLKNILNETQTIYLGVNSNGINYDYGIIKDKYDDTVGTYTQCIILDNSTTSSSLKQNEILTSLGVLDISKFAGTLQIGVKYGLYVKDGYITKLYKQFNTPEEITVSKVLASSVYKYTIGDDDGTSVALAKNITYYYNGKTVTYNTLNSLLQIDSVIIFARNSSTGNYDYAVIYDPVYSQAQVADYGTYMTGTAGTLDLNKSVMTIRNGIVSSVSSIVYQDAVYTVTDIYGGNKYNLVINNNVYGVIKGYSPSQLQPTYIQLSCYNSTTKTTEVKSFEISADFDVNSITADGISIGSSVYLILGYDGKVVSIQK